MTLAAPPPEWMTRAACLGENPELWFPHESDPPDEARAICSLCPVRAECLAFAVANDVRHGMWGGLTPAQRSRLQPRKGPQCHRCGTDLPNGRRHYCDTCKPIVRAENVARYNRTARVS